MCCNKPSIGHRSTILAQFVDAQDISYKSTPNPVVALFPGISLVKNIKLSQFMLRSMCGPSFSESFNIWSILAMQRHAMAGFPDNSD